MKPEKLQQKLDNAKNHAISKNGQCLSTEYKNNREHLTWKCSNPDHREWTASYKKVVCCGTWCPLCRNEHLKTTNSKCNVSATERMELAKQHAISKNGLCLTTNSVYLKEKLLWKCCNPEHKEWNALFESVVKRKSWCPECGITQRAVSRTLNDGLERAKAYAATLGGECLSTEYISTRHFMTWKCSNQNHKPWDAWYDTVQRAGNWCPECAREKNISENRVRYFFEEFFGKPFPSKRPDWNVNPWTGNLLELDGYCMEFNIAFEHDGEHHFKLTRKNKPKHLTYQKFKDHQKRKNCQQKGILLINIPIVDFRYRNDFEYMLKNIVEACKPHGLIFNPTNEQLVKIKHKFYTGGN